MRLKNIYLASGFSRRTELRKLAVRLGSLGFQACSSWIWIDERPDREAETWSMFAESIANQNLMDLNQADILVIDANGIRPDNNGGVHTELGFAIGKHLPIYLIGPPGNTFHWLHQVIKVKDEEELFRRLSFLLPIREKV